MPTRDSVALTKDTLVLATSTRTATGTGSSVDCQGYDAVRFAVLYGTAGDTLSSSVYIEVDCQVSDDNSTWVAAADTDIVVEHPTSINGTGAAVGTANGAHSTGAAFLATASSQLSGSPTIRFSYVGIHRYVRVVDTRGGTQSSGTASTAFCVQDHASIEPACGFLS
jgi:hypothetical protein